MALAWINQIRVARGLLVLKDCLRPEAVFKTKKAPQLHGKDFLFKSHDSCVY
jgi:hypothetical protein